METIKKAFWPKETKQQRVDNAIRSYRKNIEQQYDYKEKERLLSLIDPLKTLYKGWQGNKAYKEWRREMVKDLETLGDLVKKKESMKTIEKFFGVINEKSMLFSIYEDLKKKGNPLLPTRYQLGKLFHKPKMKEQDIAENYSATVVDDRNTENYQESEKRVKQMKTYVKGLETFGTVLRWIEEVAGLFYQGKISLKDCGEAYGLLNIEHHEYSDLYTGAKEVLARADFSEKDLNIIKKFIKEFSDAEPSFQAKQDELSKKDALLDKAGGELRQEIVDYRNQCLKMAKLPDTPGAFIRFYEAWFHNNHSIKDKDGLKAALDRTEEYINNLQIDLTGYIPAVKEIFRLIIEKSGNKHEDVIKMYEKSIEGYQQNLQNAVKNIDDFRKDIKFFMLFFPINMSSPISVAKNGLGPNFAGIKGVLEESIKMLQELPAEALRAN